jgi:hypothetical protein
MVPYMASLDGAGAAAMIEALPPDMAVGVMMNTPDDRAREVLAHTKNRALEGEGRQQGHHGTRGVRRGLTGRHRRECKTRRG